MSTRMLSTQLTWSMFLFSVILLWAASSVSAQGSAFSYQGKLNDSGNPATGSYDLQFTLFDTAGTQQSSPVVVPNVTVVNGIFTVQIDFGAGVFNGSPRFLQIGVRPAGSPNAFVDLSPRQPVTATPYALRSATASVADIATNAAQLGGLTASGFIQNTSTPQGATDFNIGGTGTAGTLNAGTQFNLSGSRILGIAGTNNLFTGINAGAVNSTGTGNSFFGRSAGLSNLGGSSNSFYGSFAGQNNQAGSSNSFFGFVAGLNNTAGSNSFFGRGAGFTNSSGTRNAFFGTNASDLNSTGSDNSSFGFNAGKSNTTGGSSVFIGSAAGFTNTTGGNITIVGAGSDVTSNGLNFATAIGSGAVVGTSDTIVLGKAAGTYNAIARPADTIQIPGELNISGSLGASILNAATQFNLGGSRILSNAGINNVFAGIDAGAFNTGSENSFFGRSAGFFNTEGNSNSFFGTDAGFANTTGSSNSFFGRTAGGANTTGIFNTIIGAFANVAANNLDHATAIGADAVVSASNSIVLGRSNSTLDKVGIGTSEPAARLHIRANAGNILLGDSGCGSPFENGFGFGSSLTCNNYSMLGDGTNTYINRATGGFIFFREGNNDQLVINPGGIVTLFVPATGGIPNQTLCRNSSSQIATCSSSQRYKTNIEPYRDGLNLINRLNPVSFNWKTTDQADIGLIAEDVMEAEPRLAYRNQKGEIEGVSYSQMSVVLINAVKEQQAQIAEQKEEIKRQQAQIDSLKKIICLDHPDAEICKPDK